MSKPLLDFLNDVSRDIRGARRVALFLDFDGTLAPIVSNPARASISGAVREVLRSLARQESVITTILSGRAVEDLSLRVRVEGLVYAGNHGLEIRWRGKRYVEPAADARRGQLRRMAKALAATFGALPGVMVEDQGLTASVHVRQAAAEDVPAVEEAVLRMVAENGALFRLNIARDAFEIVPRTGWHKGTAVEWILGRLGGQKVLPVYLGGDGSDEDAFAVLPEGITVRVGGLPVTCARYRVPGPAEVYRFLTWLEDHLAPRMPLMRTA